MVRLVLRVVAAVLAVVPPVDRIAATQKYGVVILKSALSGSRAPTAFLLVVHFVVLLLCAVVLYGCKAPTSDKPNADLEPRFEGKIARIESQTQILFAPVGDYTFEINRIVWKAVPYEITGVSHVFKFADLVEVGAGSMSVKQRNSGYVVEVIYDEVRITKPRSGGYLAVISGKSPALGFTFGVDTNSTPGVIEVDPASKIMKEPQWIREAYFDSLVNAHPQIWVNMFPNTKPFTITQSTLTLDARHLSRGSKLSGVSHLSLKGTTNLLDRRHLVIEFSTRVPFSDGKIQGLKEIGGYQLIDMVTGFPSLTKITTQAEIDGGGKTLTTTVKDVIKMRRVPPRH